ncbi:hypothetical protein [Streptomyces microflavus]|uniref:hypothetical protein n=1 Tax=Streptomyces microflavus TaxID=1919 RepID=UPI0033DF49BC
MASIYRALAEHDKARAYPEAIEVPSCTPRAREATTFRNPAVPPPLQTCKHASQRHDSGAMMIASHPYEKKERLRWLCPT